MGLFGKKHHPAGPPDVNTPVRNDRLVRKIETLHTFTTPRTMRRAAGDEAGRELGKSWLLLASRTTHPDGGPPIVDGVMRAGSEITMYSISDPSGQMILSLFTDWDAFGAHFGPDSGWSGLIQSGKGALQLGLSYPGGVWINPSGPKGTLGLPAGSFVQFAQ